MYLVEDVKLESGNLAAASNQQCVLPYQGPQASVYCADFTKEVNYYHHQDFTADLHNYNENVSASSEYFYNVSRAASPHFVDYNCKVDDRKVPEVFGSLDLRFYESNCPLNQMNVVPGSVPPNVEAFSNNHHFMLHCSEESFGK